MHMVFNRWLNAEGESPEKRDAFYRNALLGMWGVVERQDAKLPMGLQNETFNKAIRAAVKETGHAAPSQYGRHWNGNQWRMERIDIYNSIKDSTGNEEVDLSGMDNFAIVWAIIHKGWLKHDPKRTLLIS